MANHLEPLDPEKVMRLAAQAAKILAEELNPNEQEILGSLFIVLGNILIKSSDLNAEPQNKSQQNREAALEFVEIELELQKLQKRVDELTKKNTCSHEK
ncbi:hypothetical protein [Sporomusa acidovorans]|uniref:hypothetical protein n=1 Tax=Sporomusa acidovorans TaxID=112900 RepID=UPI0011600CC7|nr:hypothetical protein [Sporomusa acidovorans]